MTLKIIICFLGWAIFILSTVAVESSLLHYRNKVKDRPDLHEHFWLTAIRLLVAGGLSYFFGHWVMMLVLGLLFPFFHDGLYYQQRNRLDPGIYPDEFLSSPGKNSTAWLDFKLWQRTALAITGVITFITYLILS